MTTHNTKYTKQEKKQIVENPYFQEFINIRNLSKNSIEAYKRTLLNYTRHTQQDLTTLIQEADEEEENRIRPNNRKIRQKITNYKIHLQQQKYSNRTINLYLIQVAAFYKHFGITPPTIPKNKIHNKETHLDLIKKEHIQTAIQTSKNNKIKAMILFMASSGTAAQETCNITIQDFITATSEYHNSTRIETVIQELLHRDDIIPTWPIIRQKTNTPYFTFCTPEATKYIVRYLHEKLLFKGIPENSTLFEITPKSLQHMLGRLNDNCGFGWKDKNCRFFHSHGLRKFHASTLCDYGVSELFIDFLQGRTVSSTQQAYYKPNPEKFKERYIHAMNCVTIFDEINYKDITSSEREELEELRHRDVERERQLEEIRTRLNALDLSKLTTTY